MGPLVTLFLIVLDSWSEAEQTIEFPISAFGTEEKMGLTREWSGYWGGADHDAQ
jgi:hypothetical protein